MKMNFSEDLGSEDKRIEQRSENGVDGQGQNDEAGRGERREERDCAQAKLERLDTIDGRAASFSLVWCVRALFTRILIGTFPLPPSEMAKRRARAEDGANEGGSDDAWRTCPSASGSERSGREMEGGHP